MNPIRRTSQDTADWALYPPITNCSVAFTSELATVDSCASTHFSNLHKRKYEQPSSKPEMSKKKRYETGCVEKGVAKAAKRTFLHPDDLSSTEEKVQNHSTYVQNDFLKDLNQLVGGQIARAESLEKAKIIFEKAKKDIALCNLMLNKYVEYGSLQEAHDLLEDMKKKGIEPSIMSYNILIKGYIHNPSHNALQEICNIWQNITDLGLQPNSYTYSSLITVCTHLGTRESLNQACDFYIKFKQENFQPSLVTHNILIKYCAEIGTPGSLTQAKVFLNELQGNGIQPDLYTFTTLFQCCERAGNEEGWLFGLDLANIMKEKGVFPDQAINDLLMQLCVAFDTEASVNQALSLLKECTHSDIPRQPLLNFLVHNLVKQKRINEAKDVFIKYFTPQINRKEKLDCLDCHDLQHGTAFIQLLVYLDSKKDIKQFYVITGKGNHSKNHPLYAMKNFIREHYKEMNKQLKYPWDVHRSETNSGRLKFIYH